MLETRCRLALLHGERGSAIPFRDSGGLHRRLTGVPTDIRTGAGRPLKLAVFDCDGTLVDSQFAIFDAMAAAWERHGLGRPDAAALRRLIGLPLVEAIGRLHPGLDEAAQAAVADSYRQAFADRRQRAGALEPLYPGLREALEALEAAGILMGVATGKSGRGLRAVLEGHRLSHFFVTLQTADHGPGKPHPAMLLRALAEAGVDPADAVMIGDTSFDLQMARAARVAGLGVAWGYHEPDDLHRAGAAAVVADADEMTAAVLRLLGVNGAREAGE